MMQLQIRFVRIAECFPALNAEVSFMKIPNDRQPLNNLTQNGIVRDHNININAGFCSHSLN